MATIQDVKRAAVALRPQVNAVLMARAFAQCERDRVRPVYVECLDYCDVRDKDGKLITDPERVYLATDEAAKVYFAECSKRIKEMGYDVPDGYCPALIAEGLVRKAERLLLEAAAEYVPEMAPDRLLSCQLEVYRKALDLWIGLVVNHSGYVPPKLKVA